MKKFYFLALFCCLNVAAFAQATITTIYATGAAGSYKTGFATTTTRTSGSMRSNATGTVRRGYGVFDLSTIPAGTVIDSCVIGFNVATYGGTGTPSGWTTYGYVGDLSTVTVAATLYADLITGTSISTATYGTSTGNKTLPTTAASQAFISANVGSLVSICFTGGNARQYTMTGLAGTAATTGTHRPYMILKYCTGVSNVTATATPNPVCAGSTLTLTGAATGTTSYLWSGPGSFSSTLQSPTLTASAAAGGVYTFTAYNAGGCATSVTTASVSVNASPGAISGPSSLCPGATASLTESSTTGTWSSSNTAAVSVDASGNIYAGTPGAAVITYSFSPSGCTATYPVTTVSAPAAIEGASSFCDSSTTTLTDATYGGTWSIAPATTATISTTGVVTGLLAGPAVATYGCGSGATFNITVNPLPLPITGPDTVCQTASVTLADGSSPAGTWSSSSSSVASVDGSGHVMGIGTGPVTIIYKFPSTTCQTTYAMYVSPAPAAITGAANECAGNTITLTETVPGGTWSSSNSLIGSVDASGNVTGIVTGSIFISYTNVCGTATKSNYVEPLPDPIAGHDSVCALASSLLTDGINGGSWSSSNNAVATVPSGLSGSAMVYGVAGGLDTITYTLPTGCLVSTPFTVVNLPGAILVPGTLCPGTTMSLSDSQPGGIWTIDDSAVVSVVPNTGIITGIYPDTATVYYTMPEGCFVSAIVLVNPLPAPISGISPVCSGLTDTLTDDSLGGVWSSGTMGVATISPVGVVTSISGGTAIISYTLPATGCYVTAPVLVHPLPVPVITYNGSIETFSTGNFYVSYQWYDGTLPTNQMIIPGATSYNVAALLNDYYTVVVTDTFGCVSSSAPYQIIDLGVKNTNSANAVSIYPNPVKATLNISSSVAVNAIISDMEGRTMLSQQNAKQIDISTLANGVYMISLFDQEGHKLTTEKFIKE